MSTQTLDDFRLRNELRDALIEAELWPLLRMRRWVTMFSHEFADQVRHGEKIQTVRPTRRIERRIGDLLDQRIWSGLPYRSKQERIGWGVVDLVAPIIIYDDGFEMDGVRTSRPQDVEPFALRLGFFDWSYAAAWYGSRHTLPWRATITGWHHVRAVYRRIAA